MSKKVALFSVMPFDKVELYVKRLQKLEWQIIATVDLYEYLRQFDLEVLSINEYVEIKKIWFSSYSSS